jgi:hypothetical protein
LADRDRDLEEPMYWCSEQLFIYKDVYDKMKRPIRPMHPLDLSYMSSRNYFKDALWVVEHLNLTKLMVFKCDYHSQWILQFYATLVICGDERKTMKWMTGTTMCTSSFAIFAEVLGYTFYGDDASPYRIHGSTKPHKERLLDLYYENGVIGENSNLRPLYALLVRIFRENIDPSGGNNDAIRDVLIELLGHAHDCFTCEDESMDFQIDVMDFIYNEIYNAMIGRNTLPYAPYVMALIKHTLSAHPDYEDLFADCEEHKVKKPLHHLQAHCSSCFWL